MAETKKKKKGTKIKRAQQKAAHMSLQLLFGDVMSSTFFRRYKFTIVMVVGLLMVYITFKYECQTHMESIQALEKHLSIVKSESIRERSTYKSRTRESVMQHTIDSLHLRLHVQDQPPYLLTYDN